MTRTVVSPARELVEIVPDDEWKAITDATSDHAMIWTPAKRVLLGALWTHGEFTDANGRTTEKLLAVAAKLGGRQRTRGSNINGVWKNPVMIPAIDRNVNGKRTMAIRLQALPEKWFRHLDAEWPHVNGATPETATAPPVEEPPAVEEPQITHYEPIAEPSAEDREAAALMETIIMPEAEPADDFEPSVELSIASNVAMALLTQVVEIISAGSPEATDRRVKQLQGDLGLVEQRLGERLRENDGMRKTIRSLGDEVLALRSERDGLRRQLRAAEHNLKAATSADAQRFINEQVQRELAKIMEARPAARKAGDPK